MKNLIYFIILLVAFEFGFLLSRDSQSFFQTFVSWIVMAPFSGVAMVGVERLIKENK